MSREPCRASGGKYALRNKEFVIIAIMLQALWGLGISEVSKSKYDKKLLAEIRVTILFGWHKWLETQILDWLPDWWVQMITSV